MKSGQSSGRLATLAVGTALVLTGCDSSTEGDATPTGSSPTSQSIAQDVPTGYNPCNDIPQSVLDSENLRGKQNEDSNASGGVKWRGCAWVQTDGYSPAIRTTNLTVDMVRAKNFTDTREYAVSGRRAISTRQVDEHPEAVCTVNVEMKGGSLEFFLSNPPSNRKTGQTDTCSLARTLAEKVVATMPANV
ncbi:DUF3558 domain-containing protein [Streptomyces gardneri]|uniref:DUF3558 domain-containing protein n=1 Tax=Nocardia sputi TaxID=2943705 RepID=UPI00189346B4|nr:DUF3558 domain-containing protein [Nocardia sputi]MBF6165685.1 DUF3558 domain-containing protein [Streptomyces gardneri]UAK29892.1 DUF3558 domain-containing protein [Nocardia asteroides]